MRYRETFTAYIRPPAGIAEAVERRQDMMGRRVSRGEVIRDILLMKSEPFDQSATRGPGVKTPWEVGLPPNAGTIIRRLTAGDYPGTFDTIWDVVRLGLTRGSLGAMVRRYMYGR